MATHYYPERDKLDHISCLANSRLHRFAREALVIVKAFPQLCVYDIQVKRPPMINACFYTFPRGDEHNPILNLSITPSDLVVEFRKAQYLPAEIFHKLTWQNVGTNKRASLKRFGHAEITAWIQVYLTNIWPDHEAGLLKRGGTSAMEGIVANCFATLFPHEHIQRNIRPDSFRGKSNRPLELDIFLPTEKIAIEIQGPRHEEDAVAERDQLKVELCRSHGISLLSINWERARKELFSDSNSMESVLSQLKGMVDEVRTSDAGVVYY